MISLCGTTEPPPDREMRRIWERLMDSRIIVALFVAGLVLMTAIVLYTNLTFEPPPPPDAAVTTN